MNSVRLLSDSTKALLAGLGTAFLLGCGSSNTFCDTAQAVVTPVASYVEGMIVVGNPLSVTPTVTLNGPIVTATLVSGAIPAGMTLQPDGTVNGTPTVPGTYPFTVQLKNGFGSGLTVSGLIRVIPVGALSLGYQTPLVFPVDAVVPTQVATLLNATPGTDTRYALTGGSLAPGLALDAATGAITGKPTTPGVFPFTVTATNGTRTATANGVYTVTPVANLGLAYETPKVFPLGTAIVTQTPTLTSPTPGVATTYAVTSGILPVGLTLDVATGVISGIPTSAGVSAFTVTATNGTRTASSTSVYTVTPASALAVGYTTPLVVPTGTAIAPQLPVLTQATPGVPTTYAVTSGSLPQGLSLDPATGAVTGTPSTAGVSTFTVTATNGTRSATATATWTVTPAVALTLGYDSPVTFLLGTPITAQAATLGQATPGVPTTYAVTSGSLPTGLALDAATGLITGTPTTAGVSPFSVTATNGTRTATTPVQYVVAPADALTLAYVNPLVVTVGAAFADQVPVLDQGTPGVPTTYALASGSLPTGLSLDAATGAVTGTPTQPGVYAFTVTATNGTRSATASPTWTVTPAAALTLGYASPLGVPVGLPITAQAPVLSNPTPGVPTVYALTSGSVPTGLSLDPATGIVTGTPTAQGPFTFTVTATNGTRTASATPTWMVIPAAALTVAYTDPLVVTSGAAFTDQVPVLAQNAPWIATSYVLTAGALPLGLRLDPVTGVVSGTPTQPGVYAFTVTATNGTRTGTSSPTWTVTPAAALALGYASPLGVPVGLPVTAQVPTLTNPTPGIPTVYAVTSGSLPPGLTLDAATGIVTGTPTTQGAFTFTVTATNGTRVASATPTWMVTPVSALGLTYATSQTFPAGTGIPSQTPILANPTPGVPTVFAVTAGTLPTGLHLDASTGMVTGTPTQPGVYTFTVTATNGTRTATSSPTWTITPAAPLTVTYPGDIVVASGSSISLQTPNVSNPTPGVPTVYAVTAGTLPAGLSLDPSTGIISGTPTQPGAFTFTVTATNGTRTATSTSTYTVTPASPLGLTYTPSMWATSGQALSAGVPVLTSTTPGVLTIYSAAGLPAGLTIDPATGTISGTSTAVGVHSVTVTATNGTRSANASTTITVQRPETLDLAYTPTLSGTAGQAFSGGVPTVTLGTPGVPTTYAATGLPAGLTMNPTTGVITGTPTAPGVSIVTVTATNGTRTQQATTTLTVEQSGAMGLTYTPTMWATSGQALSAGVPVPTGTTPGVLTTYSATSLPAGLTIDPASGIISGTSTVPGVYPVTVTATNGSRSASTSTTITVERSEALDLAYTPTLSGTSGQPFTGGVPTVTLGTPGVPTTYAATGLPAGMTMNPTTGAISGTPTVPGVYAVTVTATNGTRSKTATTTLTVEESGALGMTYTPSLTTPSGQAFSGGTPTVTLATTGVTTTYSATGLPTGMSIDPATGVISGTSTVPGVYAVTVKATNGTRTATAPTTLTVERTDALVFTYTPNLAGKATQPISVGTPTVSQGTPGVTTTYTASGLPTGLTMDPTTGVISGTSTQTGVFTVTVTATNGTRQQTATTTLTLHGAADLALSYSDQSFTTGSAIPTQNPSVTSVTTGVPATYADTTPNGLPPGLTLNADGTITGTPNAAGTYTFTITLTNGTTDGTTPRTATKTVTYTVLAAPTATLAGSAYGVSGDGTILALTGTAATLTPTFSIPGGGGSATINQGINSGNAVVSGNGYATAVQTVAGTTKTYTLTVTNSLGKTVTSMITVKWVSPTATINVQNDGTTKIYTPSDAGDPDSPLHNVQIVVPDQGVYDGINPTTPLCSGDTTLTIERETTLAAGTLPTGVKDYSHTFNLQTDLLHPYPFRVPITVTLPYDPALSTPNLGTDLPVPFYWDPAYNKWVTAGLKAVDTTNHTVTFTTLLPGRYAVLGVPGLAAATGSSVALTPTIANGVDDWLQWNQGVFSNPGGSSLGMAAFAAWYGPNWKANAGNTTKPNTGLNSVFATNSDVNARALISRLANGTLETWNQAWKQTYATASNGAAVTANYALTDNQTALTLLTGLKATAQPQIFLMGDARPAVDNAVATVIYGYDGATKKFRVMDPNYPGDASTQLTITWDPAANSGAGAFTGYSRAAGYTPTLVTFAQEGQTSIHRLNDYELVFDGATRTSPWGNPPFANLNMTAIGDSSQVSNLDVTQTVTGSTNILITGKVVNGSDAPVHKYVFLSEDGKTRTAQEVDGSGNFSFTVPSLTNPYGTSFMLETSQNPCDPTFKHSGFQAFKVATLAPWFKDACFETATENRATGAVGGWTHQYVTGSLQSYPVSAGGSFQGSFTATGDVFGYSSGGSLVNGAYASFTTGFVANDAHGTVGSRLLTDPTPSVDPRAHLTVGGTDTYLPRVLSGHKSFQINDDWNQSNTNAVTGFPNHNTENMMSLSRLVQTITVPSTITHPQLSFWWAAVIQAGTNHQPWDRPYVDVIIQDMGPDTLGTPTWQNTGDAANYGNIYYHHFYAGETSFTGWRPASGFGASEWVSIPWQKMNLNMSAYKGRKVRVVIATADCTAGGHAAYAYIDSLTCE